ncbi:MAG: hypothetical protein M3R27_01950 [Bacteroidota bacterium]|nr:hypothetical protein [Bacteroidota bacterium]
MKKLLFTFIIAMAITTVNSQILSFSASTGDSEVDVVLRDVDVQAHADISFFKSDVSATFNIPRPRIESALLILSPGDLFYAAQLSISIGKPFETVVESYKKNKGKGWGVIAKEMGIKPGSAEFHAMKKSIKSKGSKTAAKGKSGGGKSSAKSSGGKPSGKSGSTSKSSDKGGDKGGKGNGKKK